MKRRWALSIPAAFGAGFVALTTIGTVGFNNHPALSSENSVNVGSFAIAQTGETAPPITTTSGAAEVALARHLKSVGAKMYGAYWCPHCHEQLSAFGQQAALQLPYIECADGGKNARPDLCKAANIEGYPTWKIKGKTLLGAQSLNDLATASGYGGSRNFKNPAPR